MPLKYISLMYVSNIFFFTRIVLHYKSLLLFLSDMQHNKDKEESTNKKRKKKNQYWNQSINKGFCLVVRDVQMLTFP